jgi:hypothetical protein
VAKTPADIKSLARAHTQAAINCWAGIMNKPTAPEAARIAAANSLMDRGWGKAVQVAEVTMRNITAREVTDEELDAIIAARGSGGDETPPTDPTQLN